MLLAIIAKGDEGIVPADARSCLLALAEQLELVKRQILEMDRRVLAWHRGSSLSRSLESIPGVGPLISTALVASIPDPKVFRSGRDLSAWIDSDLATPLPPMDGSLSTPLLEIAGARLEGVQVSVDDPGIPPASDD